MNDLIIAILRSGTPLVYVTMAGVLAQRAGVWHLGLEGLMIIGACATVLGIVATGSFMAALLIACLACVVASALLWFVIEKLRANPIIAGLGLTGLGLGGTELAVQSIFGSQAAVTAPFGAPRLGPAFGALWHPLRLRARHALCRVRALGGAAGGRASACSLPPAASIRSRRAASAQIHRGCA